MDPQIFKTPIRPPCCEFASIAELYAQFEALFLGENGLHKSTSGHVIRVFDHHFFHLASVQTASEARLYMPDHKEVIQNTHDGFGVYLLGHGGSRAKNLPSAAISLRDPCEVWVDNPKATNSKWVYIKEFDSKPYPFTVSLLTERPAEGGIIVPVSSFPCKRNDLKKWRQSKLLYSRQIQPPEGG
jgi:hypothetical protein